MDHALPDDVLAFRATTRAFVADELLPHERVVEETDRLDPALHHRLRKRAVEIGLHAFNMPAEVGGLGLSPLAQVVVREQLGHVSMALGDVVGRPPRALLACTDDQRTRFLEPAMTGDATWAFALTEPEAGSDVGAITTTATAAGDRFVLTGSKHYISHADSADFTIVFAQTRIGGENEEDVTATTGEPAKPSMALSGFLVEKGTPGMAVGRVERKMGWRGYPLAELIFEHCRVPRSNLLGEMGRGLALALGQINEARLGVAAHCVGMAQRALDLAVSHARSRTQFGRPVGRFQGVGWMLTDAAVEVEAARALVYAAARTVEQGGDARTAVSMAKLRATEMACSVADTALQVLGGAGYMADHPIEMIYRDARAFRIGEGTSEIQRNQIAKALIDG